jgi:hypothetical protein
MMSVLLSLIVEGNYQVQKLMHLLTRHEKLDLITHFLLLLSKELIVLSHHPLVHKSTSQR